MTYCRLLFNPVSAALSAVERTYMKKHRKIIFLSIAIILVLMITVESCNALNKTDEIPTETSSSSEVNGDAQDENSDIDTETTDTENEAATALATAKEQNADTVAWLCVTGTDIDNAVMQTTNNSDYLTLDENGDYSVWGSYFADYYANLTSPDSLIQNTVIYGHAENPENPDGEKFSQLFRYTELDFMQENPYIYLTVDDEILVFEIFAVFYTDIDFYYINPYPNNDDFDTFIDTVQAKNEYIFSDIEVTDQDKLLTLSTCSHKYDYENTRNQRLVVMGKLVDSSTASDSNILANPSPERPQPQNRINPRQLYSITKCGAVFLCEITENKKCLKK